MNPAGHAGLTLVELLVAVALAGMLSAALVAATQAAASGFRFQASLGDAQSSLRVSSRVLRHAIEGAGFHPEPWTGDILTPITAETTVAGNGRDELGLQRYSRLNCHGLPNPVRDVDGRPRYHLLQHRLRRNATNNLAVTCRYGPDSANLRTEILNAGLAEGVEYLQLDFAVDNDGSGRADHWRRADAVATDDAILAVRATLVVAGRERVGAAPLAHPPDGYRRRNDGRPRQVVTFIAPIYGRLR